MSTMNFDIIVNANKEEAWAVLAAFADVSVFHPAVQQSYSINGSLGQGLEAERRCEFDSTGKKYVDERIVRFIDGKEYDVEIYEGTQLPPVNDFITTLGVEAISANQTRIYIKARYTPKMGIIGQVMNVVMIKPFLSKVMKGVLSGFKHHVETGSQVQSFETLKTAGLLA